MADVHGELVCERAGDAGAVVALLHGGAGPQVTWSRQHALADRTRPSDASAVEPCEP
jgi:hypothetical protein